MNKIKWIVLTYTLPAEPSRPRVAVWRALKKIGAVNIQQSMWVLPDHAEHLAALRKICLDIEAAVGEALLMESVFYEEQHAQRVMDLFNRIRDEEFTEFIEESRKYLLEIQKEIDREKFIFAELEEEEAEFEKLSAWFVKITARDLFHASLREAAMEKRSQIETAISGYSQMVYEHETSF